MALKDSILIVEDERSISNFIQAVLSSNGYDVLTAESGAAAYSIISSRCPDLVVLDLGLPDIDGMQVIKAVRKWSRLPILVVSSRMSEREKVEALDLGADDYITKPFGISELLARIRTALRHTRTSSHLDSVAQDGTYSIGELAIDYNARRVLLRGQDVHLTQNEYKLVALLGKNAGRVLTYDYMLKEIWGPAARGDNQILRVNMANIRRKIEKNSAEPVYILTEVGVGYRMAYNGGIDE